MRHDGRMNRRLIGMALALVVASGALAVSSGTRARAAVPAPPTSGAPYWPGWDIARSLVILPSGTGGFVLDGWGALHGFGLGGHAAPAPPAGLPSWRGWDIARGVAMRTDTSGYVLDGWGGVHRFGGAPAITTTPYRPGVDFARAITLVPDGTGGFVLDSLGHLSPFGIGANAPPAVPAPRPSWSFPVARGMALLSDGSGGFVLDGYGPLHPLGAPSVIPDSPLAMWPGWDIARSVALLPDRSGGFVLDGWGGLHPFSLGDGVPTLGRSTLMTGLAHPWDLGFTPDGWLLYTERPNGISAAHVNGTARRLLLKPTDLVVSGEAGALGLALDPQYATNRRVYVCFASSAGAPTDVRVVRFTVNASTTALSNRTDIVTGLPFSSGRHSGCRPRFGPDGYLWVGTGDAAVGTNPQSATSLGGKVLRVDVNGNGAPGNLGDPYDPPKHRILNYGHRNVQGIAFAPGSPAWRGFSVEHGPDRNDEINRLVAGNFGWDPVPGYDESVPMTDLVKFPGAIRASWSSGFPTIAPSGATFLTGARWERWNGALAVAVLKGSHVRVFSTNGAGAITASTSVLANGVRLRSAVQGPDGNLYLTTDGRTGGDEIWKVVPS